MVVRNGRRHCARALAELWWPAVATHRRLLAMVKEALPDAVIVGDQTQPVYAGNQFYAPERPRSWFNSSTGYGTLGYALPAAIGAKLAAPDRQVVALIGDGGLQFTLPELASAVEAGVQIVVLVWNNQGYGEIKTYMAEKGIPEIGVDIYTPDLVAIARAYGCAAEQATSREQLRALLLGAGGRRVPTLIEVREGAAFLARKVGAALGPNRCPLPGGGALPNCIERQHDVDGFLRRDAGPVGLAVAHEARERVRFAPEPVAVRDLGPLERHPHGLAPADLQHRGAVHRRVVEIVGLMTPLSPASSACRW